MDAKQRAQFINAQGGQTAGGDAAVKICPKCHAEVKGKFCTKCGTRYEAPAAEPVKPAEPIKPAAEPFKPAEPVKPAAEPFKPAEPVKPVAEPFKLAKPVKQEPEIPEEESALAKGLPEWNIEPPQVVVRRKRR